MKLRELKALVDRAVETSQDYEDHEVVIAVKLPYATVGAIPMVAVKSVNKGFDWENGKFILTPEENLTPADRDFAETMKKLQDKVGWAEYENRNLKAEIKRLKKQLGVEE
jgi:hypothetical protein